MSAPSETPRVLMAVVTGSRGLRGEVRLKSFAADLEGVFDYGPLSDEPGTRTFSGRVTGQSKGQVFARLDGVTDRTAADAMKGTRLYLDRAALPAADEDEFYHADLVGLRAETVEGTDLGTIRAVHDFGAGASLEVLGDETGITVWPFTKAVVPVVDLAGGRVVIDPPDDVGTEAEEQA